jgi:hypothetical protein
MVAVAAVLQAVVARHHAAVPHAAVLLPVAAALHHVAVLPVAAVRQVRAVGLLPAVADAGKERFVYDSKGSCGKLQLPFFLQYK